MGVPLLGLFTICYGRVPLLFLFGGSVLVDGVRGVGVSVFVTILLWMLVTRCVLCVCFLMVL